MDWENRTFRSLDFLGFPNYRVDRFGFVWVYRMKRSGSTKGQGRYRWKRLKGKRHATKRSSPQVYRRVGLVASRGSKPVMFLVHRLVLFAFVGPPPDGMEACHDDNDGQNNELINLRWDTKVNNQRDRVRHGTRSIRGTTDDLVRKIRKDYKWRVRGYRFLGKKYGLHFMAIYNIVNRVTWRHVT